MRMLNAAMGVEIKPQPPSDDTSPGSQRMLSLVLFPFAPGVTLARRRMMNTLATKELMAITPSMIKSVKCQLTAEELASMITGILHPISHS
jgi:hypothetical protein